MKLSHRGNAKVTTITAELGDTAGDLIISLADPAGWPDGSDGPFWVSVEKGWAGEEKILCASRSGDIVQVWTSGPDNGRGGDDTTIRSHPINSPIEHVWTAEEAQAANDHHEATENVHGLPSSADIMTLSGDQTATGKKTLEGGIITDGEFTGGTVSGGVVSGTKVSAEGTQVEADFRFRNTYISDRLPTQQDGNDGDMWIYKGDGTPL